MTSSPHKVDCIHFNGYKPCAQHKLTRTECTNCTTYKKIEHRILIIKTGAAGDVIRSTPILRRLRIDFPQSEITWITLYPAFIAKGSVDKVLHFNWENCFSLSGQKFNLVINLDKSLPEALLAMRVESDERWGFITDQNGKILPANENAFHKWNTGLNDIKMLENKKHFIEELFEICGWIFKGEKYWIALPEQSAKVNFSKPGKKIIGLNTGCGERWLTRLWPVESFILLSNLLQKNGYSVLLLGGLAEDIRNREIANKTGAAYVGVKPLLEFVDLLSQCDVVVTSVTMALHVAIALEKKIILLNNIFPTNEFYLYELGKILEPQLDCRFCYKSIFDSRCQQSDCLGMIEPNVVFKEIEGIICQY